MIAIVTGATKGIGWAICQKFAENNIDLIINSRSVTDLENARTKLLEINPDIRVYIKQADLSIRDEVLAFAKFCLGQTDQVDVLVNNAGLFLPGSILEEEDGALEKMVETNLYSAYHLTRKIVPAMQKLKRAHIINMASIASFMAYPNGGSYSISKFAMLGFSKVLREELKSSGIKVTAVMPGATWSNSWAGVDLPEERLMQASDIAEAVWSLLQLSDAAVVEEIIIRPQLGDL